MVGEELINRQFLARAFAARVAKQIVIGKMAECLRSAKPQEEHKSIAPMIQAEAIALLMRKGFKDLATQVECDWEGRVNRGRAQDRSYPVLGTWTHPDAAIMNPFTCAIEIDRQNNPGHFKAALMKAAVHSLSGAYDASLFVYVLKPGWTTTDFIGDGEAQTAQLLTSLGASGVHLALLTSKN